MYKRIISLVLCVVFAVPFFGCGRRSTREPTTVPVTGTPNGEPVTEEFMNDIQFDLSLLDNKTYRLAWGEYRNLSYPEDLPEDANSEEYPVTSEITFQKDMTAHFTFNDPRVITLDINVNYEFREHNMMIDMLEDVLQPSINFQQLRYEGICFAFNTDGNLWIIYQTDHPRYEFYFGLYQPVE